MLDKHNIYANWWHKGQIIEFSHTFVAYPEDGMFGLFIFDPAPSFLAPVGWRFIATVQNELVELAIGDGVFACLECLHSNICIKI